MMFTERTMANSVTEAEVDFVGKYTTPVGLSVSVYIRFVLSQFCKVCLSNLCAMLTDLLLITNLLT